MRPRKAPRGQRYLHQNLSLEMLRRTMPMKSTPMKKPWKKMGLIARFS
jgi:hypothetical protein